MCAHACVYAERDMNVNVVRVGVSVGLVNSRVKLTFEDIY